MTWSSTLSGSSCFRPGPKSGKWASIGPELDAGQSPARHPDEDSLGRGREDWCSDRHYGGCASGGGLAS